MVAQIYLGGGLGRFAQGSVKAEAFPLARFVHGDPDIGCGGRRSRAAHLIHADNSVWRAGAAILLACIISRGRRGANPLHRVRARIHGNRLWRARGGCWDHLRRFRLPIHIQRNHQDRLTRCLDIHTLLLPAALLGLGLGACSNGDKAPADPDVAVDDLVSLRRPECGGSSTPNALRELFLERFGAPVLTGYGLTEAPTA